MNFLHPFSRYGLALILYKENLESVHDISPDKLLKHLDNGLLHFRIEAQNSLDEDYINFEYKSIKSGNTQKGIYLAPNSLTSDYDASATWDSIHDIRKGLSNIKNNDELLLEKYPITENNFKDCNLTKSILPISGKINNGNKTQGYSKTSFLELVCCAISTTNPIKPCMGYREKLEDSPLPTAIIPDLELDEMKTFIQFYDLMLDNSIEQNKLLRKKVFRKKGEKPKYTRPPIYNGNFPYAPHSSAFGVVGLLGAIGRWAKEANKIEEGRIVLESLKDRPLYLIQYGNAQSITINHYIIDLAKENKLSDIVFAIQRTQIFYSDENKRKAKDSKNQLFNFLSSRYLQLFDKPSFKDFLSVRAEYPNTLIELFNHFFMKQMNISKEIVQSVRSLGLWLNYVAYKVGDKEMEPVKEKVNDSPEHKRMKKRERDEKVNKLKQKMLVELESSVFAARRPAEIFNVIIRAGRLSGMCAPSEKDIFQEAVLTGDIDINDAKSMLMSYARTRNKYEPKTIETTESETTEVEEINTEIDVTH